MEKLTIDGRVVNPVSVKSYQELIQIEVQNSDLDTFFPFKPDTPRYAISFDDVPQGYFKILSSKYLTNGQTSMLTLHRQT